MGEETTTYKSSIQIFIIVIQNIQTNFILIVWRLLVEDLPFAMLALRVSSSLSVCCVLSVVKCYICCGLSSSYSDRVVDTLSQLFISIVSRTISMGTCIVDSETRAASLLWERAYLAFAWHRMSPELWLVSVWINVGGSHKFNCSELEAPAVLRPDLKDSCAFSLA
jgi:hypothetical protein